MSGFLIAVCGLIYGYVAIEQCWKGNYGMFITYTGYAYANIGLYILAHK
jgi:hypothetical protein